MPGSWASDVARLQSALARRHPQRAAGGRNALAGLTYQAHVALLAAVREAVESDVGPPSLLYESISDFTVLRGDATYVTCQVKRTLREKELCSALDEFEGVYLAAEQFAPDILPRLRFRVAHLTSSLADPMAVAGMWADRRDHVDAAHAVVTGLEIDGETDPLGELLSLLADEYRVPRPQEMVDRWIRHIMAEATGTTVLAGEIVNDLGAAAATDDLPFVVLSASDREPDAVVERDGGFLVGEQPKLEHLREGFFAPNPGVGELEGRFWEWYEEVTVDPALAAAGRVPMYWIEGPSGSGKSILLLQLLARLNARTGVTVLWLGDNVESLPDAVQFARLLGEDRRVVIGMDDPVVANVGEGAAYWRAAMSRLSALRQRGRIDSLPIFVCCAPSEQLHSFREYHGGDVTLASHVHSIPTAADVDRLRNWYRSRTGDHRELPTAEVRLLPAQLFFEWWKREGIQDFARRFRARMRRLGMPSLMEFVDRVLALNRLYLGYPTPAVDGVGEAVRDYLSVLERDLHFAAHRTGRRGYWLSHPHLSDILYQTWYPPDSKANVRTGHLRRAVLDAVGADTDGAAHGTIVQTIAALLDSESDPDPDPAPRITEQDAVAVLTAASEAVGPRSDALGLPALAAWVQVWATASDCTEAWDPVGAALLRLTDDIAPQRGLEPLLTALVDCGDDEGLARARDLVVANPAWEMWARVVLRLVRRGAVDGLGEHLVAGVLARPDDQERLVLFRQTLRANPHDAALRGFARSLMDEPGRPGMQLGELAADLVTEATPERDAAIGWVTRTIREENGPALAALLRQPHAPLVVLDSAKKWLTRHPTGPSAGAVFAGTLSWANIHHRPYSAALRRHFAAAGASAEAAVGADVLAAVAGLLAHRPRNASWLYLFTLLSDADRATPAMQEAGRAWLRETPDDAAWPKVWGLLAAAVSGADADLAELGIEHLPVVEDGATWPVMVQRLYSLCPVAQRPALVDLAIEWLTAHLGDVRNWALLFGATVAVAPPDRVDGLRRIGLDWLAAQPDSKQWSLVWRAALRHASDDHRPELLELAADWLESERYGWGYVFTDVLSTELGRARGTELGLPWLWNHPHDNRWPTVFAALLPWLARAEVVRLLVFWLDNVNGDGEVGYLWEVVIEDGPYPDLASDPDFNAGVVRWLRGHPAARAWWHIWSWLHTVEPASSALMEVAVTAPVVFTRRFGLGNRLGRSARDNPEVTRNAWRALAACEPGPGWVPVWSGVGQADPGPEFWDLGLKWLDDAANLGSDSYPYVWKRLWDTFPDAAERGVLEPIGLRWCRGVPTHLSWASLWMRLVEHRPPDDAELTGLGVAWLDDPVASGPSKHRATVAAMIAGTGTS